MKKNMERNITQQVIKEKKNKQWSKETVLSLIEVYKEKMFICSKHAQLS